ncbi:SAM-dependent methyltransferase [Cryptosporangium aurantiacum]|uniref:S-adenosyl methyltransferase n=1 Tax=Cryptosporangium aurantiacum TaxID=134849 RepID=A0A1M7H4E3_9ACTN|nr:SAM-dependent methyltransferase [Cryptosporangium aurantiacum]SHM23238.1 S-adenosyl methyltransferase [Cryptosporangium aurantiacum]
MADPVDTSVPSVARMYDYYLGGKDNFGVDREAVRQLDAAAPGTKALAINNRRFLQRAVRTLAAEHGIRQFIDHGSGLPTQDNVHQIAQGVDPGARVVYIDNDPIVLAHGRALLAENGNTAVIQADMRDTAAILAQPELTKLIDFDQPVAALFVSVLHCIPDGDDPAALVARVFDRLPSGSYLVISHLASDDDAVREHLTEFMLTSTGGNWGRVRKPAEIATLFGDLDVIEPGLVEISTWRPDPAFAGPKQTSLEWIEYGGVARKP